MPKRPDKQARKVALDKWKADGRAAARAALPLGRDQMQALFDWLDREVPRQGCDHTLRLTEQWLREGGHDEESVVAWLRDNSGYCDCEALVNAEQNWLDAIYDVDY